MKEYLDKLKSKLDSLNEEELQCELEKLYIANEYTHLDDREKQLIKEKIKIMASNNRSGH